MKIKAVHDNLVIRMDEPPKSVGGIAMPINYAGDASRLATGVVVDVGPGRAHYVMGEQAHLTLCQSSIGCRVAFDGALASQRKIKDADGRDLVVISDQWILARIEE